VLACLRACVGLWGGVPSPQRFNLWPVIDVTIELATVHIPAAAAASLSDGFKKLAPTDLEGLLAALLGTLRDLPHEALSSILRPRADPEAPGALLVSGMPLDDDLPPTPTEPVPPTFTPGPVSRCAILLPAIVLGEPVAYAAEKGGALVQNVFPIPGQREKPSNESSAIGLDLHTELTFSREVWAQSFDAAAPDFVLLLALRSPPERSATTSVVHARDLCRLLDAADVDVLRRPWFELRAPYSFTQDGNGARPWSPPLALVRGPEEHPEVVFDISCGVRARTPEANGALEALRRACADPAIHSAVKLREGDLLVIDNHKCAHSRSPYDAQFDGRDRWLLRSYVRRSIRSLKSAAGRSFRILA
jgi:L-asparagine oxygenase